MAVATRRQMVGPIWPARNVVALAGAALIGVGLVTVSERDLYPGWWARSANAGDRASYRGGRAGGDQSLDPVQPVAGWDRAVSHPLYLWHWPLFSFARIIEGGTPTPALTAILISASIALAWMTYRYVEMPIRHDARTGRVAAALCASLLIIGSAGGGAFLLSSHSLWPLSEASAQEPSTQDPSAQFVGPFWKYTKNDICLQRYPFQEANSFPWWFCMQNRDADPTVLLLGDSSANALYPGFAHNYALKAQTILSVGICGPGEDFQPKCAPNKRNSSRVSLQLITHLST